MCVSFSFPVRRLEIRSGVELAFIRDTFHTLDGRMPGCDIDLGEGVRR